jgi:transcription termination/antitermination protein NusG
MSEETKWYSLRVISGKERAIKERIEKEIKIEGWEEFVPSVIVPTEKVYKIRNGKKVIQERNIMPGYILIEALPSKIKGDVVTQISNVPNVIHFLGKNDPIPMQTHEAKRILGVVDDTQNTSEQLVEPFLVGESVKINEGAFADFVGEVLAIDDEKKRLKVVVKIFGRGTEMELSFMQVEKQ